MFQDSPTCLNFNDPARPHPCSDCLLMRFVPEERKEELVPCCFIPLTQSGETVDYFNRCGTQLELEEALCNWLRTAIHRIESEGRGDEEPSGRETKKEICKLAGT